MTNEITVVVADDHQIFLDGMLALFKELEPIKVLASSSDGDGLLQSIKTHMPDIALVDLSMKGATLEDIITFTQEEPAKTKIIALTMRHDAQMAKDLFALGMQGYVIKDTAFEDLLVALNIVAAGGEFISPSLLEEIEQLPEHPNVVHLTEREQEIIRCASQGNSNKQIARMLDISQSTVGFHMTTVL